MVPFICGFGSTVSYVISIVFVFVPLIVYTWFQLNKRVLLVIFLLCEQLLVLGDVFCFASSHIIVVDVW